MTKTVRFAGIAGRPSLILANLKGIEMTYKALGEGRVVSWRCEVCNRSGVAAADPVREKTAEAIAIEQHGNCTGAAKLREVK